jgi:hypothetical protein
MSNFNWQEEAISKQRVLVRAARRAGKSEAAIRWARKAGRRVLFAVPYEAMIQTNLYTMAAMYESEVTRVTKNPAVIDFVDGTRVEFVAIRNEFAVRGVRVDAVVLDEIGEMTDSAVMTVMMCAAHVADFKFFATYSSAPKNGVKRIFKLEDVHYVTVDYLDLLENGILSADTVRDIQSFVSAKSFKEEFGPYLRTEVKKRKNIFFKHLLDAGM